ncbi:MAG TPA: tryptophan synthase subunit alpha [Methylomirabilota bacterium]|nr:tryptophan synthase subunit alpha [Methylomirabilota bacterium]
MSRMEATFARLRERGERALMPYFTAGDPSLAETRRLVIAAERAGADVIELGVPFSDPIADGPVVQRAGARALAAGASLPRVLELVAGLRADGVKLPIALMTYYNPVLAFGLKSFARTALEAGADAVIVPDLPYEESDPLRAEAEPPGLDVVQFVAPTSPAARVKAIARLARGFIYVVSVTGVTGERKSLPPELDAQIRTLRLVTTKPVCVGFGVSTPEQVGSVGKLADGVLVGSAIVRLVERHTGAAGLVEEVAKFISSLKAPLRVG